MRSAEDQRLLAAEERAGVYDIGMFNDPEQGVYLYGSDPDWLYERKRDEEYDDYDF